MKFDVKFHIVALFAAMIALGAQATPVSSAQACSAVSAWAAANGSAFANPGYAVSAVPEYDADGTTVLYYKVAMSDGGLVIASPDTDLDLVVAVLEDASCDFPAGHPLPSILRKDMRNRLSIVRSSASSSGSSSGGSGVRMASMASASVQAASSAELPEDVKESVVKANAQWEKYGNASGMRFLSAGGDEPRSVSTNVFCVVKGFEKGGKFTHWDQGSVLGAPCYNYYTPDNVVCGCVATAGAAIMQFFGNAMDAGEQGPVDGGFCYLYGNPIDNKTEPGAIDWSLMDSAVSVTNETFVSMPDGTLRPVVTDVHVRLYDENARKLAGRVTYNFGVLVGMGWATEFDDKNRPVVGMKSSESSASVSRLADAFKAYGFSNARHVTFNAADGGTSQYFKMVYAQNWAGAPVVLGIQGDAGGHAVVACGYAKTSDDEELCRVFMGWGGSGDAWYRFPAVQSFKIVDEAVTMIGYDATKSADPSELLGIDETAANEMFNKYGTVPICGKINIPNAKLRFPGVTRSIDEGEGGESISFTLTASVDSNGFFAVRIPVDTKDLSVVHEESGATLVISPFNSKVLKDEEKERADVEAAMPGALLFLVLNTTVKSTVESARAKALEDNKAVLMVSGSGGVRENMLVDYLTYLDSTTDMSNRFVLVRLNSGDYSSPYGDGDPSIGVFDPNVGSAEFRWWSENGRLAYDNFIDDDADNLDGLHYTFTADNAEALTNTVTMVLDSGYDSYLRRNSGIVVAVKAIDAAGNVLDGMDGVDVAYGVHTNCWTNGQVAVFSAPVSYTNETSGIAYRCLGWTTNSSDIAGSMATNLFVELSLSNSVDFAWMWKIVGYRVNASSYPEVEGAVTPAVSWVYPNDRVTLLAEPALDGAGGLAYWDIRSGITDAEYSEAELGQYNNGRAVSFTVNGPISAVATYRSGASAADDPEEYSVGIAVNPPELAEFIEGGSVKVGDNDTYDRFLSVASLVSDIVDSTGGVWKCVGYIENGVTNALPETGHFMVSGSPEIELAWELQQPAEEEVLPEPGQISVSGLSRAADGSWKITVQGAVKDCWYWLYSSDELAKLAGDSSQWTAELAQVRETNPQQANEDGEIVFTVTSAEGKMFWRARVTATESGDK